MGFRTDKIVYYHIPKTGGGWVKNALRRSNISYRRTKSYYGTNLKHPEDLVKAHELRLKREHETPAGVLDYDKDKLFSFTFVRQPFEWYKSFWAYRMRTAGPEGKKGVVNIFPLDWIWSDNFERFIDNVLNKYPEGFLTDVYRCYVGVDGKALNFVGKQENLRADLISALTMANEPFDKKAILSTRSTNISANNDFFKSKNFFKISPRLRRDLEKSEKWIIETFYSSSKIGK